MKSNEYLTGGPEVRARPYSYAAAPVPTSAPFGYHGTVARVGGIPHTGGMKRLSAFLFVLAAAFGAVLVVRAPAVLAWACPRCYGLDEVRDGLHVDPRMTLPERAALQSALSEGRRRVSAFFGPLEGDPTFLVCATADCDARLGGADARARAFGTFFVALSASGRDATVIAHELAHIELHRRVGFLRYVTGAVPVWFNEGLAVVASRDPVSLRVTGTRLACRVEPRDTLPEGHADWSHATARPGDTVYAEAGCAVLHWIERQGGRRLALQRMQDAGWDPEIFLGD